MSFIVIDALPNLILAEFTARPRPSLIFIGLLALAGGVIMLLNHKKAIDEVTSSGQDPRIELFEQRKFRRRSLASTMIAAIGILMIALYWAHEPGAFFGLVTIILWLLVAVMFLAILDLMSVSLQTVTNKASSHEEMLEEYLRRRRQELADQKEESDSNGSILPSDE